MTELRRPLGLFLQGGGALGAWQAGALERLVAAGLCFDALMGFSIGAVNAAAYALDRLPRALARWRSLGAGVLRLSPRLRPLSLFSPRRLREFFADLDEEGAKRALRAELTIISAALDEGLPVNARFTPGGRDGWDGPLLDHLAASSAIPLIFPPVELSYRGRTLSLIDGGVPMPAPLDFSPLADCADLLVLEMVRADELGHEAWLPWTRFDQRARETGRRLVDEGLAPLLRAGRPRVFRLAPSSRLPANMLDFRSRGVRRALEQGDQDAGAFLRLIARG